MNRKRNAKHPINVDQQANWLVLLPIIVMLSVIPLIVRLKIIPVVGSAAPFWTEETNFDFFSYYKAVCIIFVGLLVLAAFFYKLIKKDLRWKSRTITIPLILFLSMILLSSLLAEYRDVALFGFPERYEGLFVWLAYLSVVLFTIYVVQGVHQVNILLYSLFVSAGLIGIIGIFQYMGLDFFQSNLGKRLILPPSMYPLAEELSFNFGVHRIYATLYNTNNVGSYMAMLFPLTFVLSYYIKDQRFRIALGLLSCLMFANLVGSHSRGGMVGVFVAFIVLIPFFLSLMQKYWKQTIILFCSYGLIFVTLNMISDGRLLNKVSSILPSEEESTEMDRFLLTDIVLGERSVSFIFEEETLMFAIEKDEIQITDKSGKVIAYQYDELEERFVLEDERFSAYQFLTDGNILAIFTERTSFNFVVTNTGFKLLNAQGELMDIEPVPSWGFEGKERLGSGRGYIWSRSIPMLKETLILGHGPDTFALYFPQHDYVGKYIGLNQNIYNVVDKPHNLYLQVGINSGLLSLFFMLVMFAVYLWQSARLYWRRNLEDFISLCGVAIFVAIIGYLVTGIFNDSLVSVAPVFWSLFGLGVACNQLYRTKLNKQST